MGGGVGLKERTQDGSEIVDCGFCLMTIRLNFQPLEVKRGEEFLEKVIQTPSGPDLSLIASSPPQ